MAEQLKLSEYELQLLRDVVKWRTEKATAEHNLKVADEKLQMAIIDSARAKIETSVVTAVLFDKTGSGVIEILNEGGYDVSVFEGLSVEED